MNELEQILNTILGASQSVLNNNKTPDRTTRGGGSRSSDSSTARPLSFGSNHPTQTSAGQSILDILNGMGMNTGGIEQLLLLLSNIGGLDAKDYQDQLYQLLLKQYLTAEQRNYDKSALEEQRIYDSPLNQLSRLMSAGIGRNAAIGMLSPTGEAGLIGSGADAQLPATVASPSDKAMQVAQTALDAIGVVGGLISLGFSAPAAIQQVKFLKNQNALTSAQLNAYNDASAAFGILNAAGASADAFGSVANASAKITELAKGGNQDAIQFVNSGGLKRLQDNSYFASPALSNLYKSERASSDYDTQFGKFIEQTNADIDFKKADKSRVEQQILNLGAEFKQIAASTEFVESQTAMQKFHEAQLKAQTDLLRKQGREIEARILETKAQTNLLVSQTKTNDLNNQLTEGIFNQDIEGKTGFEWLTQGRATDLYNDCQKFITAKDKKIWDKELNAIAADYDRLYQLNSMRLVFQSGAFHKYKNDPEFKDLIHVCTAMHECGAFDYLGMKLRAIDEQYSGDDFVTPIQKRNEIEDFRKQYGL